MDKRLPLYVGGIVFMTAGNAAFSVISSLLLKELFDMAQTGAVDTLGQVIGSKILMGVVAIIIYAYFMRVYNIEAKRGLTKVQKMVFEKAMRLPIRYYENHHSGEIISRLIYDTQGACGLYTAMLRRFTAPIISVMVYLVPMFVLCPQVTACLFTVNLVSLGVNSLMAKPMKKMGETASKKNSKMTECLSNIFQGIEIIKIFDTHHKTEDQYHEANKEYVEVQKKGMHLSATLDSLNAGFDLMCSLTFLSVGIYFVERGVTTIGSLAAIYTMYGVFSYHFLQIGRYYPVVMNCIAYANRVFEFLDEDEEPMCYKSKLEQKREIQLEDKNIEETASHHLTKVSVTPHETNKFTKTMAENSKEYEAHICFKDLSFGYNENHMILNHLNLHVAKGKTIALTGETGRGKSTLAKLLLGFYPISSGEIYIEGKPLSELGLEKVRKQIAYVPQEPYLFNVSIKENIRYGRVSATDEEIYEAAKQAYAHEFILKQPGGYDTRVGERGGNLSGGERQRIAIARAILKNAPILLLDEATSALDNESEKLVQEALNHLMKNRTTIMIAHRLTTIAMADEEIHIS